MANFIGVRIPKKNMIMTSTTSKSLKPDVDILIRDDSMGSLDSISPDKHLQYSIKTLVPKFRVRNSLNDYGDGL